ncbi:thioredoxin family protein [Dyadobacter sp. CY323]|uniref:DUF899 domain-containing protein n=1 Tax=Dyadobacter sp. CY323 TaxID=2907302 RepID=UPI001F237473|nr:thioredoxin family protein [Dyadobacter sp. CY323]MCE6987546.1 thioredoxin family protein [Dyadobacter sp. CY323]
MENQGETLESGFSDTLAGHQVVSNEEWIAARKELLKKEKELTRLSEEMNRQRRELPWELVTKNYVFDTIEGKKSLSDLFGKNSQLFIYHFMFGPDWEEGCPGCSFMADHMDGPNLHLAHHDVSLVAVSRAPLSQILPFKKRMGWQFEWVSSFESEFNYDYHVSFTEEQIEKKEVYYNYEYAIHDSGTESPGSSVFFKDESGAIYHTYSTYARGGDILLGAHNFLDMMPKGRNESTIMDWMRHHDKYEEVKPKPDSCCH